MGGCTYREWSPVATRTPPLSSRRLRFEGWVTGLAESRPTAWRDSAIKGEGAERHS